MGDIYLEVNVKINREKVQDHGDEKQRKRQKIQLEMLKWKDGDDEGVEILGNVDI